MSHTLLLADDSVTIQRVIELTFADEDVTVVAVSDGDQAIAVLEKAPPDIVLADIGMPGRNGYEVAQHIKGTPRLAHIPVVLLTGAFEPIDQAKAAAAGCDGVLAKPFEPQLVIGRVKELLAKPKQGGSIEAPPAPAWTAPAPVPVEAPAEAAQAGDYFDRLDQAFANLAAGPDAGESSSASRPPATALDWFASQPPREQGSHGGPLDAWGHPALPEARPTGEGHAAKPMSTAPVRWDVSVPPAPEASMPIMSISPAPLPPPLPTLPPLADAFAALLAAEQAAPAPAAAPRWPSPILPSPAVVATDDLVEQVTRRVLDRLTDRVMQEAVAEKVSTMAERLVRDEIEQIKKSIK